MPSIWYQIGLHCMPKTDECPYDVAGFSFAGVPGVVIGHNDKVAWGFTNVGPDVMDLYIEKVNPENANQYEVNGAWVDFETRTETINIVGGEPVEVTVKLTRHGPVISDAYGPLKNEGDPKDKEFEAFKDRAGIELPDNYVIALQWTALTPSTPFQAIWGFDKAQNWESSVRPLPTSMYLRKIFYSQMWKATSPIKCQVIFPSVQKVMAPSLSPAGQTNTNGQASYHSKICPIRSTLKKATSPRPIIRCRRSIIQTLSPTIGIMVFGAAHCEHDRERTR